MCFKDMCPQMDMYFESIIPSDTFFQTENKLSDFLRGYFWM